RSTRRRAAVSTRSRSRSSSPPTPPAATAGGCPSRRTPRRASEPSLAGTLPAPARREPDAPHLVTPKAAMELNDRARSALFRQDYRAAPRIDGVEIVELRRFRDDGGAITELGRLTAGMHEQLDGFEVRQVNYSEIAPGAIKAYHLHQRQTDVWYVPPHDKLLLVLHDCRAGSASEGTTMRFVLGDGADRLVRIPPGVAHGCTNLGATIARILYFVDLQFSAEPEETDEGRLPWDWLGASIWDVQKG